MLFCYHCGMALSEKSYCTSCGASVGRYKKILYMSNNYYNRGLAKAQIRDLTGAAEDLRQSLKLYKRNTQARNLLGLVYFEIGETVAAFSEWVISGNIQPDNNLAKAQFPVPAPWSCRLPGKQIFSAGPHAPYKGNSSGPLPDPRP